MQDLYETLGVSRDADAKEIKSAYRKLAKQYHPDKNIGDKEAEHKFKEIGAAYDILKDEQKRAAYDRYGEAAFDGTGAASANARSAGFNFSGSSSFADIFEDLFAGFGGGMRGGRGRQDDRGADLRYNLEISLEEAFNGTRAQLSVPTHISCQNCNGTGSADKSTTTCVDCDGEGAVRMVQGFFTVEHPCRRCHGTGKTVKNPCKKCSGSGRVHNTKKLSAKIPAGVEEGTRIRLAGEGEAGERGGQSGDLYIFISLKPHDLFIREGADIHCKVPITITTAMLGGAVEVPTIDGSRARLTIPEGTQSGHQFRMKSKGMTHMRSPNRRGDMYVHVAVETPVKLSKKQKQLIEELDKSSGRNNNPRLEGFMKKVKGFLKKSG